MVFLYLQLIRILENMKEYKLIKQPGTAKRRDQDFEDLLNSYAKMGWKVINVLKHRGFLKAVIERDLVED